MKVDYDIAVSFSGHDRNFVANVSDAIRRAGYSVFYDEYEQAQLWGMDLTEELPRRYESSRYVIVFFSPSYMEKMWTRFERQVIVSRFLDLRGQKYLLPVFLDGFKEDIPGIPPVVGHIAIDTARDFEKLKELILSVLSSV